MSRLFGTDGVRGLVGKELTAHLAYQLGFAGAKVLAETQHQPCLLVGMDTRASGPMLQSALCQGIEAAGGKTLSAGVIPTPAIAHLVQQNGFAAGVVISASHNPAQYNGIKFFDGSGYKLPDALENEIEAMLAHVWVGDATFEKQPEMHGAAHQAYLDFLAAQADTDLTGKTIVVDCANGAASTLAKPLFEQLGASVIVINNQPDGENINCSCGSTHPVCLCEQVKASRADLGIAFDGDADRVIACDETGTLMDGDVIMGLLALDMKRQATLKKNTLVTTVMSNMGLGLSLAPQGIGIVTTQVGDRYVLEAMKANGYNLGGEQSGHLLLTDMSTTGDGLQSAMHLACLLTRNGGKASCHAKRIQIFPQVLLNVPVAQKYKTAYMENQTVAQKIQQLNASYEGKGRLLIRPSGTEHLVRIMIEGEHLETITRDAQDLARVMEEQLQ